jgi:hypothetical protein
MREGRRPERRREAICNGTTNLDLVDLTDSRPSRWMTLSRLVAVFVACLAFKGGVVALMGYSAYASLLLQLESGNILSRFFGLLLFPDTLTLGFAELWANLRP